MMNEIIASARGSKKRIALAEGDDGRVIEGAVRAANEGLAEVILVGDASKIQVKAQAAKQDLSGIDIHDPSTSPMMDQFASIYHDLRKHRGIDEEAARVAMRDPLKFAAMLVRSDHADGTVGGAVATTADTVRAALQIIGKAANAELVSSFFLMGLSGNHLPRQGAVIFADCGLVVDPDAADLAEIAIDSAANYKSLTGSEPRVAMLSFSTMGSAKHASVTKMIEATDLVRLRAPGLLVDGELQFDAAFIPSVASAKAPGSPLKGAANVFIFPDLNAGNIGYKIAQRIGGAQAIGPVLQGLAKPANDLSRGCSADDVFNMIALTAVQAIGIRK